MNRELIITAAIIAAVVGLLLISGCSKQPQQEAQLPQEWPQVPKQAQPQQAPAVEAEAPKQVQQDDLYNDNLDGSLDDLSQIE